MAMWLMLQSSAPQDGNPAYCHMPPPDSAQSWPFFPISASRADIRTALLGIYPDQPPERIRRDVERVWDFLNRIQEEDILVFFNPEKQQLRFAEVTAGISYRLEAGGLGYPCRWLPQEIPLHTMRRVGEPLKGAGKWPVEIADVKLRTALRDRLRLPGTRFARWKWLLAFVLMVKLALFGMHLWKQEQEALHPSSSPYQTTR